MESALACRLFAELLSSAFQLRSSSDRALRQNTLSPSDTTYSRSKMPARRRPAYSRLILTFGRACGGHFNQPSLWQTRRSVGFAPAAVDRRAAAIEQWCDAMIFVAVGSLTGMVTRMQRAAHGSDAQQWDMEIRALMRGG